jgi:S-formylglutathione hydrolase FrmB
VRTAFFACLPLRRVATGAWSLALAGLLSASAFAGVVKETTIDSAAIGRPLEVSIYQPDGAAPKDGWPVLYLLHGLNGCHRDWPSLGGIRETMDRLIADHRIKPMLVVMPDGGNSWYVDSASIGGPGNYETAILDDLPKAIERTYPVSRERDGRAIAGLSMGGYGALRLALKRPDRFVAVASLSGAIWQNAPPQGEIRAPGRTVTADEYFHHIDAATVVGGVDAPPDGKHFGRAFGTPFDAKLFDAENVFTLLEQKLRDNVDLPSIYLTVGDHDSHLLWRGSIALYETLMADGVDVDFRVTGGDHVWSLWSQSIKDVLVFVDAKFAAKIRDASAGKPKIAGAEVLVK